MEAASAVARGDGERNAGGGGIVDGHGTGIVGIAASAEAQVRDVDVVGGVAVLVRIGGALDGRDHIRLAAAAGRTEHFVRDQRNIGSDAGDRVRLPRHDSGDVRTVARVVHRIGVVVHEIPAAFDFESRPETFSEGVVRIVDSGIDDGHRHAGAARAER